MSELKLSELGALATASVLLQTQKPTAAVMKSAYVLTSAYPEGGFKLPLAGSLFGEISTAIDSLNGQTINYADALQNAGMKKHVDSGKIQFLTNLFPKDGAIPDIEKQRELITQFMVNFAREDIAKVKPLVEKIPDNQVGEMFDNIVIKPLLGDVGNYTIALTALEKHKGGGQCAPDCNVAEAIKQANSQAPSELMGGAKPSQSR